MLHRLSCIIRYLFAILLVMSLGGWPASIPAAAQPALTASFDWSVPDRLVVDSEGRVNNFVNSGDVTPESWPVMFDACASTGSIATHRWSVDGVPAGESPACAGFTYNFPDEGSYLVTLTAIGTDGTSSAPASRIVIVQDFLIVAMGDSYASGEGAPDTPIPPDAWLAVVDAGNELAAARDAFNAAKDDLMSIEEDLADLRDDLAAAIAARQTRLAELNVLLTQTQAVRNKQQDVIEAENAVNAARAHRDAVCPLSFSCPAARTALTARQAELAAANAALAVELAKVGLEGLAFNAIEAALQALEEAKRTAWEAANLAVSAAQTAVAAAEAAKAAAEAAVNVAQEARDAAQAAFNLATQNANPEWGTDPEDRRCHRSSASGQVQAALLLEQNDPKTSVTLLHLACSGATISEGLVGLYDGVEGGDKDIAPQVTAANHLTSTIQVDTNPPHITVVQREIDAVVISIGGNDIEFAGIVEKCIYEEPCYNPEFDAARKAQEQAAIDLYCSMLPGVTLASFLGDELPHQTCVTAFNPDNLPPLTASELFYEALDELDDRYFSLDSLIEEQLKGLLPDRVYLTEYPDLTKDESGNYCGFDPSDGAAAMLLQLPGLTAQEFEWADQEPLTLLNAAIRDAAQEHGWTPVGGIYHAFRTHGYCSDESWVVRMHESILQQDDIYGTVHPTRIGQHVYRDQIHAALLEDLYIVPPGDPANPAIPRAAEDGDVAVKSCPDAHPDLLLTDYDSRQAEFFTFTNTGALPVDLDGCHAATWNAIAENVIWAAPLEGVVLPGDFYTVANTGGDFVLPTNSMVRGPGGVTILGSPISAGSSVQDALGSVVSSMIYINESMVFMQSPSAAAAAKSDDLSFADALSAAAAAALPMSFALEQNYPNPFNPTTTITFDLPEDAHVEVEIYDVLGRSVAVLVDRELTSGRHSIAWSADGLASGSYIYRIEAGAFTATRRMMLLK